MIVESEDLVKEDKPVCYAREIDVSLGRLRDAGTWKV